MYVFFGLIMIIMILIIIHAITASKKRHDLQLEISNLKTQYEKCINEKNAILSSTEQTILKNRNEDIKFINGFKTLLNSIIKLEGTKDHVSYIAGTVQGLKILVPTLTNISIIEKQKKRHAKDERWVCIYSSNEEFKHFFDKNLIAGNHLTLPNNVAYGSLAFFSKLPYRMKQTLNLILDNFLNYKVYAKVLLKTSLKHVMLIATYPKTTSLTFLEKESLEYVSKMLILYYEIKSFLERDSHVHEHIIEVAITNLEQIIKNNPYHSVKVQNIAEKFGYFLDLGEQQIELLTKSALYHDIGLIFIPEVFEVDPEDPLTPEQKQKILRHPIIGAQIANSLFKDPNMKNIILQHHEDFNGKGYPMGLKGTNIIYLARILRIIDSFDAVLRCP